MLAAYQRGLVRLHPGEAAREVTLWPQLHVLSGRHRCSSDVGGQERPTESCRTPQPLSSTELWCCPGSGAGGLCTERTLVQGEIGLVLPASRFLLTCRKLQIACQALEVSNQWKLVQLYVAGLPGWASRPWITRHITPCALKGTPFPMTLISDFNSVCQNHRGSPWDYKRLFFPMTQLGKVSK